MNDTFQKDGWQKIMDLKKKKEEKDGTNCFSTLARQQIQIQKLDNDDENYGQTIPSFPSMSVQPSRVKGSQIRKSHQ